MSDQKNLYILSKNNLKTKVRSQTSVVFLDKNFKDISYPLTMAKWIVIAGFFFFLLKEINIIDVAKIPSHYSPQSHFPSSFSEAATTMSLRCIILF